MCTNINEKIVSIASFEYYKNKEESNDLFQNSPHMFFLSCIMTSGYSEKAFNLGNQLAADYGADFNSLYNAVKNNDETLGKYLKKFSYHNNDKYFKSAVRKIHDDYKGDVSKIWKESKNCAGVISKCLEFEGVSVKKGTMIANLLIRICGIDFEDKSSCDISPDVHVKRTMCKLGLIKNEKNLKYSNIDNYEVIYKARSIYPEFPGILDFVFWRIGFEGICTNNVCYSGKKGICPFADFCSQRN